MGLNYSINLYFEVERLEAALRATAEFAIPLGESTSIVLPSGYELTLPFSRSPLSGSEDRDRIVESGELGICLVSVLRFQLDDEIAYFGNQDEIKHEENVAEIYLYLYIHVGWRYGELAFTAATSGKSSMLERSASIHQRFRQLIREIGGVAGIIDVERGDEFLWLDDPTQIVKLNIRNFLLDDFDPKQGGTDYDVDGFTTALLAECDRLREQAQDQPS